MGQLMSHPLTEKSMEYEPSKRMSCAVGSMQGYRLTQEDAHLSATCIPNFIYTAHDGHVKDIKIDLFGVFDGHGGFSASQFVAKHMTETVVESFKCYKPLRKFSTEDGYISDILKHAFLLLDNKLFNANLQQSGSTGILCCIVDNEKLFVANTGDSRCILSVKGAPKTLSFDHKPNHIGELIRINDAGGHVSLGRVGGVLALSRAFGDFSFKTRVFNNLDHLLPSEETQVTVEPDIIPHKIDFERDEFIVLACDGIWDVFKNGELLEFIRHQLCLGHKLDQVVGKVLDRGIQHADASTGVGFDNMTIIVVALQKPGESLDKWYDRIRMRVQLQKGIA